MSSLKYMDIVDWAKEQIAIGAFQHKKKFFSESKLGEIFGFSRQTVRRALDELEQMGYITRVRGSGTYITDNQLITEPKTLVKEKSSMVVGIVSTHLDAYIFPSIIEGIESVLSAGGYTTLLTSTKNLIEGEIRALQLMLERRLDGLIVGATKSGLPSINTALYRTISQKGIPIVFVDSFYPDLTAPYVALDDYEAGYVAVQHLIKKGHRDIAGIFTHSDIQGHLRYKGFMRGLMENGISIRDDRIIWYSKENMLQILYSEDLWESLSTCTAALCYNDSLAIMLMNLLKQKGKRVPEDISVVGIDNSELAQIHSLTSIAHPGEQLGKAAARLLLSMINGVEGKNILFPAQLVERSTVRNKEKKYDIIE